MSYPGQHIQCIAHKFTKRPLHIPSNENPYNNTPFSFHPSVNTCICDDENHRTNTMFGATSIKLEEQIQYLTQQVSNSNKKYKFGATATTSEEQLHYLIQQASDSKNKYNDWCNKYQNRRTNTILDTTSIKLEANAMFRATSIKFVEQIQYVAQQVSRSKNKYNI